MKKTTLLLIILVFSYCLNAQESGKTYAEVMLWIQFNCKQNGFNSENGDAITNFTFDNNLCKIDIARKNTIHVFEFDIKNLDLDSPFSVNEFFILKIHFKKSPFSVSDNKNGKWQSYFCEIPLNEKDDMHLRIYNAFKNAQNYYYREFEIPSENRF